MSRVRVLVVDDSALMRKLIPQMLEADALIEVSTDGGLQRDRPQREDISVAAAVTKIARDRLDS